MEITTVPIRHVHALLNAALQQGLDGANLLREADISTELLSDKRARVTASAYATLAQTITVELEDECSGLLATPCKPGTFEMMCHACINCPTLESFLERGIQFYGLVNDSLQLGLSREGDKASYTLSVRSNSAGAEDFLTFILFGIIHRLVSWAIDQPLVLQSASFTCPRPEAANEYNSLLKTPIAFNQPLNSLHFSAHYLSLPIQQNNQTLETLLTAPGPQLMGLSSSSNSLVIKIKRLIKHQVGSEFPEFEAIAEQLCSTTVTLRRRLREEGSSYQQIKDDLRRDTAIYNLTKGAMSIEEVAEVVGFSEPTSFFRAFKRWTGVTPRAYLSQQQ